MKIAKKILKLGFRLALLFVVLSVISVAIYTVLPPPITPIMLKRSFDGTMDGKSVGISKSWVAFEDISPNFFRALIASEDSRFFQHSGIDLKALEEARKYNERNPKRRRHGASTISMQTAKNVFLLHQRSYIRKALEAYFTVLIEGIWGKRRILEVYANVVEFGEGIYGIETAAQHHFGKSAAKLTRREISLLVATLPNPRRWSASRPTNYILRRASTIRARMQGVSLKPITE